MKIELLLHVTERHKESFTLTSGIRPRGIILAISKGSYRLTFPTLGNTHTFSPYEIAYIPPNTEFIREVITPIDFHQFTFSFSDEGDKSYTIPHAGRLNIPKSQVKAILESADMISACTDDSTWLDEHLTERILIENHIFSSCPNSRELSCEIKHAIAFINEHISEPITVSSIAELLHLSHNGLIWKFKQELNTTPQNYITGCRIKLAKQLLLDDNLTVTQIAERCGYTNAYYFSNAFKKAEGISPSVFKGKF